MIWKIIGCVAERGASKLVGFSLLCGSPSGVGLCSCRSGGVAGVPASSAELVRALVMAAVPRFG